MHTLVGVRLLSVKSPERTMDSGEAVQPLAKRIADDPAPLVDLFWAKDYHPMPVYNVLKGLCCIRLPLTKRPEGTIHSGEVVEPLAKNSKRSHHQTAD